MGLYTGERPPSVYYIRPRRANQNEWDEKNPVLLEGELAMVKYKDSKGRINYRFIVGDGKNKYTERPYVDDYVFELLQDQTIMLREYTDSALLISKNYTDIRFNTVTNKFKIAAIIGFGLMIGLFLTCYTLFSKIIELEKRLDTYQEYYIEEEGEVINER